MARERSQRDVEDGLPPHRTQRMSFLLLSTHASSSETVTTILQTTLSPTERALYAALAPTPSTSAVLKAVCRTWEDHLWALVSIACEERLSLGLARIARECFWESGLGALESSATGETNEVPDEEEEEGEEVEDEESDDDDGDDDEDGQAERDTDDEREPEDNTEDYDLLIEFGHNEDDGHSGGETDAQETGDHADDSDSPARPNPALPAGGTHNAMQVDENAPSSSVRRSERVLLKRKADEAKATRSKRSRQD